MKNKDRKSFVFNAKWAEVLDGYPAEVRLEVYDAVVRYAISGTLSELKPLAAMAFSFIKSDIDYNNERYDEVVEKRSEAGKKGMEKRWGRRNDDDSITNDNKNNKNNKSYQTITNDNKNNLYVNDNDNEVKKEISTNVDIKKESPNGLMSPVGDASSVNYQKMVIFFNSEVEKHKSIIPKINDIKNKRKDAVNARVREYGKEALIKAIEKAVSSPFLNGKNSRSFIASFDWIMKPNNFPKVLEGNYDEKMVEYGNNRTVNSEENRRQRQLDAFGIISRLAEEDGGGSVNIR